MNDAAAPPGTAATSRRPRADAATRPAWRIAVRTLEGRPATARESAVANNYCGTGVQTAIALNWLSLLFAGHSCPRISPPGLVCECTLT
jgi:hypothetical protein